MTERRDRTATESLLSVAYGVEMAAVLFGFIAMVGVHREKLIEIIVTCLLIFLVLYLAMMTLRRGVTPLVYVSQALLLLPVITEPLWVFSWALCLVFWTYCLLKGRSLDRRKGIE